MELRFRERVWCAAGDVIVFFLLLFVSLFLAFVRCPAMAIDMSRVVVCWNHIDGGVAVWWVSPYESLDNSLHMALTPC